MSSVFGDRAVESLDISLLASFDFIPKAQHSDYLSMPVGNMIIRSEKSEIWAKPPTELGPGQYNTDVPDFKPRSGLAPFSSTAERRTCEVSLNTPGPGTYNFDHSSKKVSVRPSSQFISQSERMGGERQRLREMDTPGPGAYAPELVQVAPKGISSRPFHNADGINWVKVATAPSIPSAGQSNGYDEGSGGRLIQQSGPQSGISSTPGPGSYDTSLNAVRGHGRIYQTWGRARAAEKSVDPTPGPGAYDSRFVQDSPLMRGGVGSKRMQSMFASTTGRAKLSPDSYGPGPGGYTTSSSFQSLKQFLAANPDTYSAFGSSAKNPRASISESKVPGPGTYMLNGSPAGSSKLGPQFASTSQRFPNAVSSTPGPGCYDDSRARFTSGIDAKTKGRFGVFGTTSSRFVNEQVQNFPPVGAYETARDIPNPAEARRRDIRSSAFRSPGRPKAGASDERPLAYDTQREWPKAHSTSTAFVSSVPRFGVQSANNVPGPGSYTPDLHAPRGHMGRTPGFGQGSRFESVEYRNTPGPGSYDASSDLNRRTFNITIGGKW